MPLSPQVCVEVCVDSVESAVAAIKGGATRLEICGNLGLGGGTTPSMGLLRSVQKALPEIEVMVMIRPRTGDFLYTDLELEVMLEDIRLFKQENIAGIVFGVLRADGTVDTVRTRSGKANARWGITTFGASKIATVLQSVCFHRAFDMTRDPYEGQHGRSFFMSLTPNDLPPALQAIVSVGDITRILTSGHGRIAPESLETLSSIATLALRLQPAITILPGSGINVTTIHKLVSSAWWKEFKEIHLSGGQWDDGAMEFRKEGMGMGLGELCDWSVWKTHSECVSEVRRIAEVALKRNS